MPTWLIVTLSGLVILFGLFRISLAFRKKEDRAAKGLYSYPARTQVLIGIIYVVLGVLLILPVFGVRIPLFGSFTK
jgi:hypothetical protein